MAHESFEDVEIAKYVNENFVAIKVDREERPDIDAVYMSATQAMTGQGGWPMTCFLTPEAEPFYCGTYFPPQPRAGLPSFRQLVTAVHESWTTDRDSVVGAAQEIRAELAKRTQPLRAAAVTTEVIASVLDSLGKTFDAQHGGFGRAPKFPPSMLLRFLARNYERTGDARVKSWLDKTLSEMANGGLYDQVAGGFSRYCVDHEWTVPHFEKMLYDNALLLEVYAYLGRDDEEKARIARGTADFLVQEFLVENTAFAASFDADAAGQEGSTYVWTLPQLVDVLGPQDGAWAAQFFGVTADGNFEHGASVLTRRTKKAEKPGIMEKLARARAERVQPPCDDKIVAEWNGYAIAALAKAAQWLDQPAWLEAAQTAATHILATQVDIDERRIYRTSRDGRRGSALGVLADYGSLATAFLTLHQVTGVQTWLTIAMHLLDGAVDRFANPDVPGAYFDADSSAEALVSRPSDPTDNATPSGQGLIAEALLLASLLCDEEKSSNYRELAEQALARSGMLIAHEPRFAGQWLALAEQLEAGPIQVAIVGGAGDVERAELVRKTWASLPNTAVAVVGDPAASPTGLLAHRTLVNGQAAAYVCRGFVCERPVTVSEWTSFTAS
jgi:uncharacterized protein YyaL (SSP411 family)